MAFDPDEYIGGEFNPDEYIGSIPAAETPKAIPDYRKVFASDAGVSDNLVESTLKKRGEVAEAKKSLESGKIGRAKFELTRAGKVAGLAADVQFFPIDMALKAVPDGIKESVGNAIGSFINSVGIGDGIKSYNEWAKNNPDDARAVEGAVNIASYATGLSGGSKEILKTSTSKAVKDLKQFSRKRTYSHKKAFTDDLTTPMQTPKELERRVPNTDVPKGARRLNPLAKSKYNLSPYEERVSRTVAKIPKVSPSNHIQKNYNIIRDHNNVLGNKLEARLNKISEKFTFLNADPVKTINEDLIKISNVTSKLKGVNPKRAAAIVELAKGHLKGVKTPAQLLRARRSFDADVLKQLDDKLLTDASQADKLIVDSVRTSMNNVLHESVPEGVRGSLKQQSLLFDALRNIVPKAAAEANTALGRAWDAVKVLVPAKAAVILGGASMGMSATNTLQAMAPYLLASAAIVPVGYAAGKVVSSPKTLHMATQMITALEEAAKIAGNVAKRKEILAIANGLRSSIADVTIDNREPNNE